MAQGRPNTPESQLLKLIEHPSTEGLSREIIKRRGRNIFSLSAIKGKISYFRKRIKLRSGGLRIKFPKNLREINKALEFTIIILFLYMLQDVIFSIYKLDKHSDLTLGQNERGLVESAEVTPMLKKLSYYIEKPTHRDIFKFKEEAVQPSKEKISLPPIEIPKVETTPKIQAMIKDLRLVGISWSEDPDVMIENTSTKTTYFLKRGQKIEGKITIEAVFPEKIVLSYEGEEVELK